MGTRTYIMGTRTYIMGTRTYSVIVYTQGPHSAGRCVGDGKDVWEMVPVADTCMCVSYTHVHTHMHTHMHTHIHSSVLLNARYDTHTHRLHTHPDYTHTHTHTHTHTYTHSSVER